MKRSDRIKYHLIMGFGRVIGALPDWFIYGCLGRFIYFVIYRVIGYRIKVVRRNLCRAFPEKNEQERRDIERNFYKHLAELVINIIDMSNISYDDLRDHLRMENIEQHRAETTGRSWVAMMAHFGCWEYFGAYQLYDERAQVVGVYHPLRNAAFDRYFYAIRSRFGLLPMPMKDIARFGIRHRDGYDGRPIVYGMIADQRPPQDDKNQTFDFLGCPTSFFMGSEWIARRLGLPAYFLRVNKVGRAKYSCRWECIYDGQEEVAEGEITRRYVEALDAMIRREPHLYLWSHRRWKHLDIAEDAARRVAKTK